MVDSHDMRKHKISTDLVDAAEIILETRKLKSTLD